MLLKELIKVNIEREKQEIQAGLVSEAGGESVLMQDTKSTN